MTGHTRREFLKHTVMTGSALALAPLAANAQQSATEAQQTAQMCIAKWKGEAATPDAVKAMATKLTEQAVASIGGMEKFVKKGDVVWIKPNMAWDRAPEMAANTNPDVVATIVRMCLNAGAKMVKVGDYTCNEAAKSYVSSGIADAVKAAGGEAVFLDESRFKEVELKGQVLAKWPLYPEIIESDLVINVPVVKHHAVAKVTACMKNYMGVIGGARAQWHQNLDKCLCDITAYMKPRICIVDAVRILTAHGPTGGNLKDVKQLNMVAAGTDIVALDTWAFELLGLKPEAIGLLKTAQAAGLGKVDYRSFVKELEVA